MTSFKELAAVPGRTRFAATDGDGAAQSARELLGRILSTEGADKLPTVIHALNDDGTIDWNKYANQDIYITMLRNKGQGFRAIVCEPAPPREAFLENEEARAWVLDLLETQISHRQVKSLRAPKGDITAPITNDDIASIPLTITDYITSQRGGGSAVALWNQEATNIIRVFSKRFASFRAARITRDLLRKAIESQQFAETLYPVFEEKGVFVTIANMLIKQGETSGLDTTLITRWLNEREEAELDDSETYDDDFESLNVDDMFAEMTARKEEKAA